MHLSMSAPGPAFLCQHRIQPGHAPFLMALISLLSGSELLQPELQHHGDGMQ